MLGVADNRNCTFLFSKYGKFLFYTLDGKIYGVLNTITGKNFCSNAPSTESELRFNDVISALLKIKDKDEVKCTDDENSFCFIQGDSLILINLLNLDIQETPLENFRQKNEEIINISFGLNNSEHIYFLTHSDGVVKIRTNDSTIFESAIKVFPIDNQFKLSSRGSISFFDESNYSFSLVYKDENKKHKAYYHLLSNNKKFEWLIGLEDYPILTPQTYMALSQKVLPIKYGNLFYALTYGESFEEKSILTWNGSLPHENLKSSIVFSDDLEYLFLIETLHFSESDKYNYYKNLSFWIFNQKKCLWLRKIDLTKGYYSRAEKCEEAYFINENKNILLLNLNCLAIILDSLTGVEIYKFKFEKSFEFASMLPNFKDKFIVSDKFSITLYDINESFDKMFQTEIIQNISGLSRYLLPNEEEILGLKPLGDELNLIILNNKNQLKFHNFLTNEEKVIFDVNYYFEQLKGSNNFNIESEFDLISLREEISFSNIEVCNSKKYIALVCKTKTSNNFILLLSSQGQMLYHLNLKIDKYDPIKKVRFSMGGEKILVLQEHSLYVEIFDLLGGDQMVTKSCLQYQCHEKILECCCYPKDFRKII